MTGGDAVLGRAVGYALTGIVPTADGPEPFDPAELVELLGGATRLRAHAAETRAAGRPWPHPVPAELRDGLGAAQLYAAVEQARNLVDAPATKVRGPAAAPGADDLRLLREVPPHHGG